MRQHFSIAVLDLFALTSFQGQAFGDTQKTPPASPVVCMPNAYSLLHLYYTCVLETLKITAPYLRFPLLSP